MDIVQAAALTSLEEATRLLRDTVALHRTRIRGALDAGVPVPRIAEAAGLSYDQLRMRISRGGYR